MTEWKIKETLDDLSPEEKQILLQGLIDKEKELRKGSVKELVQRLGLWALAIGGVASTIAGISLKETATTSSLLFSLGGLIAAGATIIIPQYLESGSETITDCIKETYSAHQSVKYLQSIAKEIGNEMI